MLASVSVITSILSTHIAIVTADRRVLASKSRAASSVSASVSTSARNFGVGASGLVVASIGGTQVVIIASD